MEFPENETLTIEFKSDKRCYPLEKLYYDLSAMANTEGGMLYLGIEDDGMVTGVNKQHADEKQIEALVRENTMPPLSVKASLVQDTQTSLNVLVIKVPTARQLQATSDGKYGQRRLQSNGTPQIWPLSPSEIVQRLSFIQALDPSAQVIEDITTDEAFSPLEHNRLRKLLGIYHGDQKLLPLSDSEIDLALDFAKKRDGVLHPTIAGLLIVGKEPYIREYVPSHEVLFQILDGTKVIMNTPAMHSSLLEVFENVDLLFKSRVSEQEVQVGLFRVPIPNYEPDAFREGFVNALVHRDYFRMGAVTIQMQPRQLSISSPGGFVEGITTENILTAAPSPRNRLLAEATKRIGLSERTGRGVDKIYMVMIRSGHPFPDYSASSLYSVILRLDSSEMDKEFVRMLVEEEAKLNEVLPVDALIVLSVLRDEHRATLSMLASRIQKQIHDARSVTEWLVEHGMVEGIGNGKGRYYILSAKVYSLSGNPSGYLKQKGKTSSEETLVIVDALEKQGSIVRNDITILCHCTPNHASFLLSLLVRAGTIEKKGNGRQTYYVKKKKQF